MNNYAMQELEKINPCGIKSDFSTHCKYSKECSAYGKNTGGFVCLSKTGHNIAQYLINGSDIETETEGIKEFINNVIGKSFVDPKKTEWSPITIDKSNVATVVNEVISRGKTYHDTASGSSVYKNPLNFECETKDIIKDLQ